MDRKKDASTEVQVLKENYKDKREELDDILYDMEVPKVLFYNLKELNLFLAHGRKEHPDCAKALDLIHEISPVRLTHFTI